MKTKDSLIQIVKSQIQNKISNVDFSVNYEDDYLTENNEEPHL